MKNMKVRTKLVTGFLIVTALTLVIGLTGVYSLYRLETDYTLAIELHGKPLEDAGHAVADLHAVRAELRAAMLFTGNRERVQAQAGLVQGFLDDFEARTAAYDATVVAPDSRALFTEAMDTYRDDLLPAVEQTLTDAENGVPQADLVAYMVSTIKPAVDLVTENMAQCMTNKANNLETTSAEGAALASRVFVLLPALLIVVSVISVTLGLYISGLISKPLAALTAFMKKAGGTGNITITAEDDAMMEHYSQNRDEIGQCIGSTEDFIRHVTGVAEKLDSIANGDLSVDVKLLSSEDTMGYSLKNLTDNLNTMFSEINMSAKQVSTGASQVADGAQALAAGSTQQAASIQQLSSSIAEIAGQTKHNAEVAEHTAQLAGTIKGSAEKGSQQMGEMMSAVKDINQSSQDISKVIKVIDDIAFQTNILALNAAVEAARAGQHGKGFAVVAEEVRNLAAKSAEAAKDTESLIANSMQKAALGVKIADETASSLSEIVSGIDESSQLIMEIATASDTQSLGISQINIGIDQVAQVVQQNSATAQESAAASEEMSGQSTMLQQLIAQFKLKDGSAGHTLSADATRRIAIPEHTGLALDSGVGLGKY